MFSRHIDNQTAILISIIDIYSEIEAQSPLLSKAGKHATKLLVEGIRESRTEDKIHFCSIAISALTQNIIDKIHAERRMKDFRSLTLEREELDFIHSLGS